MWAAEFKGFQYTWLDDKQEVLYGMRFVNKNDMQKLVSEIYVNGKSLYIVPNPVVVNEVPGWTEGIFDSSNEVNLGVYGHVLWWRRNKVESENVTLIAWTDNTVRTWNDNAAFLWWDGNKHIGKSGWTPVVVVWWQKNEVWDDHDGVALIWWKGNKVGESVSNAFLLWWRDNYVEDNIKNVIVWWQKVDVNSTDNIFVYSNDSSSTFTPKSSNAFYLNMGKGVGINTDASDKWLAVKGPVSLGEIDITKETCDSDNLWVEWSYQWCVVWCTKASMEAEDGSKWEMLDRGQKCLDICAVSSDCIYEKDEEIPPKPDYKAFCTEWVDTDGAELCFPDELSGYQNVIFETSLVDNGNCDMAKGENKCVYQCKSGYHLAKDITQASNLGEDKGKIKCFKDCDLTELLSDDWKNEDWSPIILKHNQTITAYNKEVVECSYDRYGELKRTIDPKYTLKDYLDDGFGRKVPIKWIALDNAPKSLSYRYKLPEHCGNNAHKQKLVCANETLYILSSDGKTATTKLAKDPWSLGDGYLWYQHEGYIYKTCTTTGYICDTSEGNYQWSKDDILGTLDDTVTERKTEDRAQFDWRRWKYKLCLDYRWVAPETCEQVDTLNSTKTVHDVHYKFMWCQTNDGYRPFTGDDWVVRCMKQCSVQAFDSKWIQKTIIRKHKGNYEFYLSWSETCTGVCESQRFECNDGTFYQSWYDGNYSKTREKLNYKYSECGLHDNMCNTDEYNVTASVYEQWKDYWTYISCDDHLNSSPKWRNHKDPTLDTKYNKQCVEDITHYKLVDCNPGYHTEDNERCILNVWDEPCENKPNNSHWVRETQVLSNYPWSNLITKYLDNKLSAGKYLRRWDESCDWNGPKDSCKTDELQDGNEGEVIPGEACKWECNTWYRNNGGYCQKIDTSCQYPEDNQNACMNTEPYACKDQEHTSIENQKLDSDGVTWRWDCVNGIESDRKSCMLCKDGYHIEWGKCVKNIDGECNNNLSPDSSIDYACNHWTPVDKNSTDPEKYTWDCAGTPTNYDAPNVPLRKPWPDCSAAEDDYGCYKCKVGYHKTSTYGECEINECSKQNEPEWEGVIKWEWIPATNNKGWNHVNSTNLWPCEWTCEKWYVQNGNSCRPVKCTWDGFDTTTATQITTIEGADTDVPHTVYDDEATARNNYCAWVCKEGYVKDGNSCRPVKCTWDGFNPTKARQVTTIDGSDADVEHKLYKDEDTAKGHYCAWVCNDDHKLNAAWNDCVEKSSMCGFDPGKCIIDSESVTVDYTYSNHKWTRNCPNIATPCNMCDEENWYEPDGNGNCVEKNNYRWRCLGSCERRLQTNTPGSNSVECETQDKSRCNWGCEWRNYWWAKCIKESSDCGSYNSSLIGGDCIVDDSNCSNEEKPMCIVPDPNKVWPVAHVKNSISANPMKVVAYINGKEYKAFCQVSKWWSNSCSFSGEKLTPGDNYTIIIYPIYEDWSLWAKCNLEPSGVENRIDQRWWMWWSNVGGVRQGYVWNCEDELPRCAFNGSYCSRWTKVEGYLMTYWEHWECKGMWKYSNESKECELNWNCSGSCSWDWSAGCGDDGAPLYPNNGKWYAWFWEMTCKNAGYMVNYWSNGENNGFEPCRLSSELLQSPYNLVPLCSGRYGWCAKWTANLYCTIKDSWNSNTYYNNEAINKCGTSGISKPSCESSSVAWPFGVWGSSGKCQAKANAVHSNWCAAVYPNWITPYNGSSWISGSSSTAWWNSYCSNQKTQAACQDVKVASMCVSNCNGPSWVPVFVFNVPWSQGSNISLTDCCEWR